MTSRTAPASYTSRTTTGLILGVALTVAGCGGSGDDARDAAPAAQSTTSMTPSTLDTETPPTEPPFTEPPTETPVNPAATTTMAGETTVAPAAPPDEGWQQEVEARCLEAGGQTAAIVANDGTAAGIAEEARATKAVFQSDPFGGLALPETLQRTLSTLGADAVEHLDRSIELVAAGDLVAAQRALDEGFDRLSRTATAIAIAGARCGFADPARVENADLTIPLEMGSEQINTGFGSIWVSEWFAGRVVRLDAETGEVQAEIDVGDGPLKVQPADGRMWVRTAVEYVAIDPATNTVVATLAKADVGPAANRSWAVDGAMWICDGRRLHRYDPTTLDRVTTLDVNLDCGAVYANGGLAVAWSYDEEPPQSGTSAAAFVDPATNSVLATVALPVDVGGPAILEDAAFFHGYQGSIGVVVDRETWTVTATPDLGVAGGGTGQAAFDGDAIYVVDEAHQDVLVVDSSTFAVIDVIEPLGVNAVAVDDEGRVWVARGQPINAVQRFDPDQR